MSAVLNILNRPVKLQTQLCIRSIINYYFHMSACRQTHAITLREPRFRIMRLKDKNIKKSTDGWSLHDATNQFKNDTSGEVTSANLFAESAKKNNNYRMTHQTS